MSVRTQYPIPITQYTVVIVGHHLILGTLEDHITGETLDDTLDERLRQDLARLLIDKKGFDKTQIEPRRQVILTACGKQASIHLDFIVWIDGRVCMIVKYGPGSLVTRHRPALGLSRLIEPYQIPLVVVTNGRDADILDGQSGKRLASGLGGIPSHSDILNKLQSFGFKPISRERAEGESRIVFAYEIDNACPCDDTICRISE